MIVRALRGVPTHTADDVRRMLLGQTAHLWVQDGNPVAAMAITEFAAYPQGVWLRVWLGATRDDATPFDTEAFVKATRQWYRYHNCRGFEAIGRQGWLKRVPGARAEGFVMRITEL